MKKIIYSLLFVLLLGSVAHSDPHEPVTPWPLDMGRQTIGAETLLGIWTSPALSEGDEWVMIVSPAELGRSYTWELFLRSSPQIRTGGLVYIRDAYVIGKMQSPFAPAEFVVMYLSDMKLHFQMGSVGGPRIDNIFKRKSSEFIEN